MFSCPSHYFNSKDFCATFFPEHFLECHGEERLSLAINGWEFSGKSLVELIDRVRENTER